MSVPLRSLGHSVPVHFSIREAVQQQPYLVSSRPPSSVFRAAAATRRLLRAYSTSNSQDGKKDDDTSIRERAIKAHEPNYTGWWTEVMNYHTTPQTSVDPSPPILPAKTTSVPTANEIKKGYGNVLARAPTENTLPRAASLGSTTFITGTGSTLSAASAESTNYHGFAIPVKPSPPGAEDCCMSGCAHCIYDIYEEDRQEYKTKLAETLDEIAKAGLPPPPNINTKAAGGDGASASGAQSTHDEDDDMDPGMKAFLELERKLKGS
ncbi:hypothetical protein BGZ95_001296 [Linnemannia exigua]|uniref:Oxidoreductase-like domain-containing protein n=1 Tax=Linnemannia exigua TaxID=604196 RepID=A0AAD4D723_9FUNG|nr:hypothetical protein BGZ95_001296 [Linnemannia exigua]